MEDCLALDELYTTEERMLRDNVHRWVDATVIPKMLNAYEQAEFPRELIPEISKLGLLFPFQCFLYLF